VHNFRISWQNGFRFPSLFEAYSFVNNGGVKRVGGLAIVEQGLGYYSNSVLTNSVTAFNTAVNTAASQQGISRQQAAVQNAGLLKVANPQPLKPEQISSFEAGYKTSLLNNRLFIDAEGYYNIYRFFIGQLEVSVPNKGNVSNLQDTALLNSFISSTGYARYRVQVNSQSPVESYGFAAGISYSFYKTFSVSANANYNKLAKTNQNDPLIPGFNTPDWMSNVSL